jgi:transposase
VRRSLQRPESEQVAIHCRCCYANGEHIAQRDANGITSYVPVKRAVNNQGGGGRTIEAHSPTTLPAIALSVPTGKTLVRKQLSRTDKIVIYAARGDDCAICPDKPHCATAPQRYVTRHLYEAALEANARRVQQKLQMMSLRRQTVKHPFDFIKHRSLGNAWLLLRGITGTPN